jgi:DNA polymerase I-like protein with 3'-5' exonuclease and polymerase domains
MSQQNEEEDLDAFLDMFGKDEPAAPAAMPAAVVAAEPTPEPDSYPDGTDINEDPVEAFEEAMSPVAPVAMVKAIVEDDGDDPLDFLENSGMKRDRQVPDISKPWMVHHEFRLVTSVAEVNEIVDECIKRGSCSLDLECTGLDNRIIYREDGSPDTVDKIVGFCISYDGHTGFYIPIRHKPNDGYPDLNVGPLAEVEQAISRLCHAAIPEGTQDDKDKDALSYKCSPPKLVIYFWNAQFDQEFLYPVTGIDWWHPESFECGMLASFVINAGDKGIGLKPKAKQFLRDKDGNPYEMIELKELFFGKSREIRFDKLAPDEPGVLRYAGSDAICTYLLCKLPNIVAECHKNKFSFTYRLEKQVACALRPMERSRVRIARDKVREILLEKEALKADLLERIRKFALEERGLTDLDPNSPKQLGEFLFGDLPKGLDLRPKPERNEASQQFKTDGDTLSGLAKLPNAPTILKDIVEYREAEKFIGTYLLGLVNNPDENDELRFSFKQTGAGSGRFSAPGGKPDHGYSGIPIHGIPGDSEVRRSFVGRTGYTIVKADYAAEELRIAANVSDEQVWIKEFLHGTGDLHTITGRSIFGKQELSKEERNVGKIVNFLLIYGGGPKAVMRNTGCDELEGKRRKQGFDKSVPTFIEWSKRQHKKVKEDLGVTTAFKRWLAIPDANSPDGAVRSACERYSTNYPIQGAGADILKISMVLLHKKFHKMGWLRNGGDDSVRMLLCVHDEIVFEIRNDRVAEAVPIIVDIMESPWRIPQNPKWQVPLVVEPLVGFNWASGYKAERAHKDQVPKEHEVLMNGFIYSLTRKPKTNKKDEIVENLDQNEIIQEVVSKGETKQVFRIIDAPWVVSANSTPSPTEPSGGTPRDVPPTSILPPSKESVAASPAPVVQRQPSSPPTSAAQRAKQNPRVLKLRLEKLNDHTAEQVCRIIIDCIDNDEGYDLHITDVVGNVTLIEPGRFPVVKEKLIEQLVERNLLCLSDLENDSASA